MKRRGRTLKRIRCYGNAHGRGLYASGGEVDVSTALTHPL